MHRVTAILYLFGAACLVAATSTPSLAQGIETVAEQALLVDTSDDTVLLAKGADQPIDPSSLAKIMTAEILMAELAAGEISEETPFRVSENAWRTGGAPSGAVAMFLRPNTDAPAIDLLRGITVQSGNDAAKVIAETLSGSEEAFADRMNERAAQLGLTDTVFRNATGFYDPEQRTTLRDMVRLSEHIRTTYPQYWPLFSEEGYEWNKIYQRNRNPAIAFGGDGVKVGASSEEGQNIVATKAQAGRRVYLAMAGLETTAERARETERLFDIALDGYGRRRLIEPGTVLGEVPVFGGIAERVGVAPQSGVSPLLPIDGEGVAAEIVYEAPLAAPVAEGDQIASLSITVSGRETSRLPLFATQNVPALGLFERAGESIMELAFGWMRGIRLPWRSDS